VRESLCLDRGWEGFSDEESDAVQSRFVGLLRQADVDLGKGGNVPDVCRRLGISQQTYYRWRTKYGGMDPKMAKQLQELQKENSRLKKLVADQALDMLILKEAARPNGSCPERRRRTVESVRRTSGQEKVSEKKGLSCLGQNRCAASPSQEGRRRP